MKLWKRNNAKTANTLSEDSLDGGKIKLLREHLVRKVGTELTYTMLAVTLLMLHKGNLDKAMDMIKKHENK